MTAITIVLIINFLMLAANVAMFVGNRKILDKMGQVIHKLNEGVMAETITERDAFAMAALKCFDTDIFGDPYDYLAEKAYKVADAMMEKREQE